MYKIITKICCVVSILLLSAWASSAKPQKDATSNKLNTCKVSKSYINNYEPETFNKTNNLLRQLDQLKIAPGNQISLHGRVVDTNCNPVANAKILIWQVNSSGKYPYKPLRNKVKEKLIHIDLNSTFSGSGTAVTDNLGEFSFVTIYPGNIGKEGAHINIRAELHKKVYHQTKVYLGKDVVQPKYEDKELNYYMFDKIVYPFDGNVYQFQIVVDTKQHPAEKKDNNPHH